MAGGETEWIAGSSRTRQAHANTRLGREAAIFPVDAMHSKDLESRRADYRSMHFVQQIFTASIIWLCRGGKDNVWLGRVPCTWLAAEALQFHGKDHLRISFNDYQCKARSI